jgi:hypothetical protein
VTTAASQNSRARLVEYVPWLARDYMTNQGPSTAIAILLIAVLTISPALQGVTGGRATMGEIPLEIATRMLRLMVTPLAIIGTLFATNGIIANDRKLGYYRFLFSKPLSPLAFYATTFAVHGAGLLLICAGLLGIWSLAVRPMFPLGVFVVMFIMYVAYGGLGFLLSAAWRFDWFSLLTVLLVANVGWTVWGAVGGLRHWVLYVLPPVHRAGEVYALVFRDAATPFPWKSIAWLLAYGAICFALGLVVIRKRPLGTN